MWTLWGEALVCSLTQECFCTLQKKNKSHTTRHKELDERGGKKSHSLSLLTSNKVISFQYLALKTIFSYVNLPSFFSDSFGSLKDKAGDSLRFSHCQQIPCADPNQQ